MTVSFYDGKPVLVKVPERIVYEVTETIMASGSGSSDSKQVAYKPATLDCGAVVSVPEFINVGDKIYVDIMEQKYISRVR
ncbi:hypothetical protein HK104_001945 [Borealophlyctis nickersoniae]|nr:hypothetical protein HK104_001945 [Borealophlyctis nickersoniae]